MVEFEGVLFGGCSVETVLFGGALRGFRVFGA